MAGSNNSIALKTLSWLLGIFFVFLGVLKISCIISTELHRDLRKEFVKYAKILPVTQLFGMKIPAKWYRRVFGFLEILCGAGLSLVPNDLVKRIANVVLISLMTLSVYSHYMIGDKFERLAPTMVFFFMLVGRLVIEWQINRQTELTAATAGSNDSKAQKQD